MFEATVLDILPLWAIFIVSTTLILVAVEIGFALGRRKLKRDAPLQIGASVAATLGLLAFMLAFTFGSGTSRLDEKRLLLLKETNAIATAFLRADLLPAPHRTAAQDLLAQYVDQRLQLIDELQSLPKEHSRNQMSDLLLAGIAESKSIQDRLWQQAVEVSAVQPSPLTALFVSAINDVFDLHQERVTTSVQQRMPMAFWWVLYFLATLAMGLAGYDAGVSRNTRNLSGWTVALAFSTVITLVVGLDRPQTSVVEHTPLLELQQDMHLVLQRP